MPSLESIFEANLSARSSSSQRALKLEKKELSDSSMLSLASWMSVGLEDSGVTSLRLDLSENRITDAGVKTLLEWFTAHQDHVQVKVLKLHKNQIGNEGAYQLGKLIKKVKYSIEELHLSHNLIEREGIAAILRALADAKFEDNYLYPRLQKKSYIPIWLRLEFNKGVNLEEVLENWKKHVIQTRDAPSNFEPACHIYGAWHQGVINCRPAQCFRGSQSGPPLCHILIGASPKGVYAVSTLPQRTGKRTPVKVTTQYITPKLATATKNDVTKEKTLQINAWSRPPCKAASGKAATIEESSAPASSTVEESKTSKPPASSKAARAISSKAPAEAKPTHTASASATQSSAKATPLNHPSSVSTAAAHTTSAAAERCSLSNSSQSSGPSVSKPDEADEVAFSVPRPEDAISSQRTYSDDYDLEDAYPLYFFLDASALLEMQGLVNAGKFFPFSLPGLLTMCDAKSIFLYQPEVSKSPEDVGDAKASSLEGNINCISLLILRDVMNELTKVSSTHPKWSEMEESLYAYMNRLATHQLMEFLNGLPPEEPLSMITEKASAKAKSLQLNDEIVRTIEYALIWASNLYATSVPGNTQKRPIDVCFITGSERTRRFFEYLYSSDPKVPYLPCVSIYHLNHYIATRFPQLNTLLSLPPPQLTEGEDDELAASVYAKHPVSELPMVSALDLASIVLEVLDNDKFLRMSNCADTGSLPPSLLDGGMISHGEDGVRTPMMYQLLGNQAGSGASTVALDARGDAMFDCNRLGSDASSPYMFPSLGVGFAGSCASYSEAHSTTPPHDGGLMPPHTLSSGASVDRTSSVVHTTTHLSSTYHVPAYPTVSPGVVMGSSRMLHSFTPPTSRGGGGGGGGMVGGSIPLVHHQEMDKLGHHSKGGAPPGVSQGATRHYSHPSFQGPIGGTVSGMGSGGGGVRTPHHSEATSAGGDGGASSSQQLPMYMHSPIHGLKGQGGMSETVNMLGGAPLRGLPPRYLHDGNNDIRDGSNGGMNTNRLMGYGYSEADVSSLGFMPQASNGGGAPLASSIPDGELESLFRRDDLIDRTVRRLNNERIPKASLLVPVLRDELSLAISIVNEMAGALISKEEGGYSKAMVSSCLREADIAIARWTGLLRGYFGEEDDA